MKISITVIVFYIAIILSSCKSNFHKTPKNPFSQDTVQETYVDAMGNEYLRVEDIIARYRYPVEVHHVTTEDGYILGLQRIPRRNARPFLLQHGLLDSSASFVVMGPRISLAYLLWEIGYDVWLGNARGNFYSRNHTSISPFDPRFWDFSWDDIGMYDLPAMVDYILNRTAQQKLVYAGHSQGTTISYVLCSSRPEYNQKFALIHSLAPVAYMSNIKCLLTELGYLVPVLARVMPELLPRSFLFRLLCSTSPLAVITCLEIAYLLFGRNPPQINSTLFPMILTQAPAGASTNQPIHYLQLYKSGKFRGFDRGRAGNLAKYGTEEPPDYNLSKMTAPVMLHYGENDMLSDPVDISRLQLELGRPVATYQVPDPQWSHMDFVWGIDVRRLLYNHLIRFTERFLNTEENSV